MDCFAVIYFVLICCVLVHFLRFLATGCKRGSLGNDEARSVVHVNAEGVSEPRCQSEGSSVLTEETGGFVHIRLRLFVDSAKSLIRVSCLNPELFSRSEEVIIAPSA